MKASEANGGGEIRADAAYTLEDFQSRVRLSKDGMRSARQQGLKVIYKHRRGYVRGSDWLEYLEKTEA